MKMVENVFDDFGSVWRVGTCLLGASVGSWHPAGGFRVAILGHKSADLDPLQKIKLLIFAI